MTKPFLFFLVLAAVLGISLGVAFIGGVAVGRGQASSAGSDPQSAAAFGAGGPQAARFSGSGQTGESQRSPGAGLTSRAGSSPVLQSRGQAGASDTGDRLGGRGGLMGTVESIEGNTVTINTPQGPVRATLGDETSITRMVEGTADDLQVGAQVRVLGEEVEGQDVAATSVIIIPEGSEGIFRPGFSTKGGPQRGGLGQ